MATLVGIFLAAWQFHSAATEFELSREFQARQHLFEVDTRISEGLNRISYLRAAVAAGVGPVEPRIAALASAIDALDNYVVAANNIGQAAAFMSREWELMLERLCSTFEDVSYLAGSGTDRIMERTREICRSG